MIGNRIRQKRIELGMSQQELADKTGYSSRGAIQRIECGTRDIKQGKIVAFANALGVTPEYLLGWDDKESPNNSQFREPISDSDLKFALFNAQDGITDEMLEEVRQFAEFVKNKK